MQEQTREIIKEQKDATKGQDKKHARATSEQNEVIGMLEEKLEMPEGKKVGGAILRRKNRGMGAHRPSGGMSCRCRIENKPQPV